MSNGFVVWSKEYGYFDGKIFHADGVNYLAYNMFKDGDNIKVYKTENAALKAAERIKNKCNFEGDCRVLPK